MTAWKRYTSKSSIALLMLVIWIVSDGFTALARAQVQPPRRNAQITINPGEESKVENTEVNVGKSLVGIARRASLQSKDKLVDIVLVIERGEKMKTSIVAIDSHLGDVVREFEEAGVDFQIAPIWFQNHRGPKYEGSRFKNSLRAVQDGLYIDFRHDHSKGYGLDAIMWGLRELHYRQDARKHMIVVTNSPLQTTWDAANAKQQLTNRIIGRCKQEKIRIDVFGVNDAAQLRFADETGGKWYPIDEYQQRRWPSAFTDKRILKIAGIFELIGEHFVETVKSPSDIVFVFDSSFSMDNKTDEICTGVDSVSAILDERGLDYRFGVIRFWARAGGGESTIVVTKPPLDAEQVKKIFRLPKEGDEHLLDAIMEGVPKLQTPNNRQLVLIIVTDETTSRRLEKGYTPGKGIAVCRHAGAIVYIIGGFVYPRQSERDTFQLRVAEVTKGEHYAMPGTQLSDVRW